MNLPRKPPRSNVPLLRQLVPSLETTCESELVPSLKGIITVDNTQGRIDASSFKAFSAFPDALRDGLGSPQLNDDGLNVDDVVNIQFTSGCAFPLKKVLEPGILKFDDASGGLAEQLQCRRPHA